MNNKRTFIPLLILSTAVILGLVVLLKSMLLIDFGSNSLWILIVIFVSIATLSFILKRFYLDMKNGVPFKDERSKKIKLYAAGYSYIASVYIWLVLLAFRKYFDSDDLILTGMLGMIISFAVSLFIMSRKKDLD